MRYLTRAAVGLTTGLLLLSGCSAIGGLIPGSGASSAPAASSAASDASSAPATSDSSGQSVQDACTALGNAMSEASTTMQTAMQDAGTDPEKAVKALQAFKDSLTEAATKIDNAEVKAQVQKVVDSLTKLIPLFQDGLSDPTKMADAVSAMSDFQTELSAFGTLCTG